VAATAEGVFVIIDRATGPMRRMQRQAEMTDRAFGNLGDRLDHVVTPDTVKNISATNNEMTKLERTERSVSRETDTLGRTLRRTERDSTSLKRSLVSLGAVFGSLSMILRPAFMIGKFMALGSAIGAVVQAIGALAGGVVALLPRIVDMVGAVGALPAALTALGGAMAVVSLATKDLSQALGGNAEALKRLTPQARSFLETLKLYQPAMDRLKRAAQEGLFPGLESSIRRAQRAIPVLERLLRLYGQTLGGAVSRATTRFTRRGFLADFEMLGRQGATLLDRGARALEHLVSALVQVGVAARPFTNWLSKTLLDWAAFWDQSARAGRESGRLTVFFSRARQSLELFGDILRNVWETFRNIGRAARPLGDDLWRSFDRATKRWADLTSGVERQIELTKQFNSLRPAIEQIVGLFADLGMAIWRMGQEDSLPGIVAGLRQMVDVLERALNTLVREFGPPLISLINSVLRLFENISANESPMVLFVRTLDSAVRGMNWLIEHVPGLQGMISAAFSVYVITRFSSALTGVITKMGVLGALGGAGAARGGVRALATGGSPFISGAEGAAAGGIGSRILRSGIGRIGAGALTAYFLQRNLSNELGLNASFQTADQQQSQGLIASRLAGVGGPRAQLRVLEGMVPANIRQDARNNPMSATYGDYGGPWVRAVLAEIDARRDVVRMLDDEKRARQEARAPGQARQTARALGVRASADGLQQAFQPFAHGVSEDLANIASPRGQRLFAQALLDNLHVAQRHNKALRGSFAMTSQFLLGEFRRLGNDIQIINGRIFMSTDSAWEHIRRSLTSKVEKARQDVTSGFTQIQLAAIGALQQMGFNRAQARRIVSRLEVGAAAGLDRLSQAPQRPTGVQRARGGRIPGTGLQDTVPVPGGMAAPGELIVNRHTEARVDRLLSMLGTSLSREVGREDVPHYRAGPGGGAGRHRLGGVPQGGMVTGDTDFVPQMMQALSSMSRSTGRPIYVTSGRRTLAEQAAAVAEHGQYSASNPTGAAAPSMSAPHVRGIAADISPDRNTFGNVASRFGLVFPLSSEPWHVELAGARGGAMGGVAGAIMAQLGIKPLRAPRSGAGGVPGVLANRGLAAMAAGMTNAVNQSLGSSSLGATLGGTAGGNAANMALARAMMISGGWPPSQWPALRSLWMGESGFQTQIANSSSGAYGIPQALPGSKMAVAGADWRTNPATQIRWGLSYIRGRYGSPANAYQSWLSRDPHWYAQGGRAGMPLSVGAPPRVNISGGSRTVNVRVGDIYVSGGGSGGVGAQIRAAVEAELSAFAQELAGGVGDD
jgi:hypothetical protein